MEITRLTFLLIALGAASAAHLLATAKADRRTGTAVAIAGLALVLTLVVTADVISADLQPSLTPVKTDLSSAERIGWVVAHIALAGLFGVLLYDTLAYVRRRDGEATVAGVLGRLAPAIVAGVIGASDVTLSRLLGAFERVETPVLSFDLRQSSETESTFFGPQGDANGPEESAESFFQYGAATADAAVAAGRSGIRQIISFCADVPGVNCDPPEDEAAGASLARALAFEADHIDRLQVMTACLQEYSQAFENGVPVQDELSEIAADYANYAPVAAGPAPAPQIAPPSPGAVGVSPHRQVMAGGLLADRAASSNLEKHLTRFGEWRAHQGESSLCADIRSAIPEGVPALVQQYREGAPPYSTLLPHRAILTAALLTSAGYADEALGHLRRQLDEMDRMFGDAGADTRANFLRLKLRLPLMYELAYLNDYAGRRRRAVETAAALGEAVGGYLRSEGLDTHAPDKMFGACGDKLDAAGSIGQQTDQTRRFVDILNDSVANSAALRSLKAEAAASPDIALEQYQAWLRSLIEFYVTTQLQNYEALVHYDPLAENRGGGASMLDPSALRALSAWWRIADESPHMLSECLNLSDAWTYYYRFSFAYYYGRLQIRRADFIQQRWALGYLDGASSWHARADRREAVQVACEGLKALRRALELDAQIAGAGPAGAYLADAIAKQRNDARQTLRTVARSVRTCES